jgi:glycolate dehydrogenase iron-sulfur subunit
MRTHFSAEQLLHPAIADAEVALRKCVHCGFCMPHCPTYTLLGNELDSPRGRIYLIQHMLESQAPPPAETVLHIDRCLTCLACKSACPSGVNYLHLIDHARSHIETHFRRPWPERVLRRLIGALLTRRAWFRIATTLARITRPAAKLARGRVRNLWLTAPTQTHASAPTDRAGRFAALGVRRLRVALLSGCVQPALAPQINAATVRLLTRHGVEVVIAPGAGCCGALPQHLGHSERARVLARAQVAAWSQLLEQGGLDAIVITTSGCGTLIKDYGHLLREEPAWAERAQRVSALALDISEFLLQVELNFHTPQSLRVTYQSACSLQHGQSVRTPAQQLLTRAGFKVLEPAEAHLCCGSAGSYSLLQPELAGQLRERKAAHLNTLNASVIASGNIGCMTHLASAVQVPIVHTIELLDWASGGPKPQALSGRDS